MKRYSCTGGIIHDVNKNDNAIRLHNGRLDIIAVDSKFDKETRHRFRYGSFEYGLYQRDHIPYILIDIAEMKFDYHVNAFDLLPGTKRKYLHRFNGKASFTFLLPHTFTEMVQRRFTFNPHFVDHLKSCLRLQWRYYKNEEAVIKKMHELEEYLATEEMFEASKLYKAPAVKKGQGRYQFLSK